MASEFEKAVSTLINIHQKKITDTKLAFWQYLASFIVTKNERWFEEANNCRLDIWNWKSKELTTQQRSDIWLEQAIQYLKRKDNKE